MKTFRLKLISILIPALAMATTANAMIMLSVNGSTSVNEISILPGTNLLIDIYSTNVNPYGCYVEIVGSGEWTGNYVIYPPPECIIIDLDPGDKVLYFEYPYCGPEYPIQPGKHADIEFQCLGPGDVQIQLWDMEYENILDTVVVHQAAPDLGDAPDSTNNFGVPMTTYPGSGVQANYPTVFNDGNDLNPRGPIHKQPLAVAYLGQGVSGELEADSGWDEDPCNNIVPQYDIANLDGGDDCIKADKIWYLGYYPETFDFNVTVVAPNVPLYVNVWFDWNQDGDWDDLLDFCGTPAPEWAVQNQQLLFSQPGLHKVSSSPFMPWDFLKESAWNDFIWMRITLSEQPWTGSGSGGSGPVDGYQYGETEDYLLHVVSFYLLCFPAEHPDFCEWLKANLPPCWCILRQCHGDADNTSELVKNKGYYFVHFKDLGILLSAWNVREPPEGPGIKWPNTQICADFDHGPPEYIKGKGYYRVHFKDMGILLANWNVREPPQGPGIPPDCMKVP